MEYLCWKNFGDHSSFSTLKIKRNLVTLLGNISLGFSYTWCHFIFETLQNAHGRWYSDFTDKKTKLKEFKPCFLAWVINDHDRVFVLFPLPHDSSGLFISKEMITRTNNSKEKTWHFTVFLWNPIRGWKGF